jgi:hypothetical protein
MAVHRRWVFGCVCLILFAGCSKEPAKPTGAVIQRPEPVYRIAYKTSDTGIDKTPRWYEVTQDACKAISDPANSPVVPFAPWTGARRLIGFAVSGSSAVAGLNRQGFLLFEEALGGDLSLYAIGGGEKVAPFSALAIGLIPRSELDLGSEAPLPALLVARDPYFVDFSDASLPPVPEEPLVTLDLRDCSLVAVRPRAFSPRDMNIEALDKGADGNWYYKAAMVDPSGQNSTVQGGSGPKQYFSVPRLSDEGVKIDRGTYQRALNPQPFAAMPKVVQSLMRSFTDSQRKHHYPLLQLVQPDTPLQETFAADPTVKNEVPLSGGESEIIRFLGFSDGKRAVVVLPDGRGVIRQSKVEAFNLPPLADGFVYTGIVMLPHWIIASWEEQESFAVGSAGFLLLPL